MLVEESHLGKQMYHTDTFALIHKNLKPNWNMEERTFSHVPFADSGVGIPLMEQIKVSD
jgi:hypothetical protein